MKAIKYLSWLMGITIFLFGVLKFIQPFKGWVEGQIHLSGLPPFSIPLVIFGEIVTGIAFILPFIFSNNLQKQKTHLLYGACASIIIMMAVVIYVHTRPEVPAGILPLKIKAPYIPAIYILMAITDIYLLKKYSKKS